jgi:uncharacterized membrane protein YccC
MQRGRHLSRAVGYSIGWVVFLVAFRRGWKLAKVRTQLQDLEARLCSVDWSDANQARTQLRELEARLRSVDRSYADRVRMQLEDLEARLRSVDRSFADLRRTASPARVGLAPHTDGFGI